MMQYSIEKEMANSLNDLYITIKDDQENKTIPAGLESRLEKVSKEHIRIVASNTIEYLKEYEFKVRGSTGNVYNVKIGPKLDCDCRDHRIRGIHCKHILYVLIKEIGYKDLSSIIFTTIYPSDNVLYDVFSTYHPKA